jgi:hypothetical protein
MEILTPTLVGTSGDGDLSLRVNVPPKEWRVGFCESIL